MANFDRQAVEAALERRLEEIRATRAGMRRESEGMISSELAHLDNHPGDEGTETFEQELEATTDIFLTDEERRIEDARRALAAGTYGTCADCGREIAGARLAAVPEAIRCLECQRRVECGSDQRPFATEA
jgi:RNA polymerase-binding transcription factor DksA